MAKQKQEARLDARPGPRHLSSAVGYLVHPRMPPCWQLACVWLKVLKAQLSF